MVKHKWNVYEMYIYAIIFFTNNNSMGLSVAVNEGTNRMLAQ